MKFEIPFILLQGALCSFLCLKGEEHGIMENINLECYDG